MYKYIVQLVVLIIETEDAYASLIFEQASSIPVRGMVPSVLFNSHGIHDLLFKSLQRWGVGLQQCVFSWCVFRSIWRRRRGHCITNMFSTAYHLMQIQRLFMATGCLLVESSHLKRQQIWLKGRRPKHFGLTLPLLADDPITPLDSGLRNDASCSGGHAYPLPLLCKPPAYLCWFPVEWGWTREIDSANISYVVLNI